jgi:hypothetical protein
MENLLFMLPGKTRKNKNESHVRVNGEAGRGMPNEHENHNRVNLFSICNAQFAEAMVKRDALQIFHLDRRNKIDEEASE